MLPSIGVQRKSAFRVLGTEVFPVPEAVCLWKRRMDRIAELVGFWLLVLGKEVKFIHKVNDPCSSLNAFVQFEMELGCMLDDDPAREQKLKVRSPCIELGDDSLTLLLRADHGHENVGVFEVGGDVHLLDGHQLRVKMNLTPEQVAQFTSEEFVNAVESVFCHS